MQIVGFPMGRLKYTKQKATLQQKFDKGSQTCLGQFSGTSNKTHLNKLMTWDMDCSICPCHEPMLAISVENT